MSRYTSNVLVRMLRHVTMEELSSKEFERIEEILSNELNEDTIKEIDKMTSLLEAYTEKVNITNVRLEKWASVWNDVMLILSLL